MQSHLHRCHPTEALRGNHEDRDEEDIDEDRESVDTGKSILVPNDNTRIFPATNWKGFFPEHDDATDNIKPLPPSIKFRVNGGRKAEFPYSGKYIYVILFDEPHTLYYCYDLQLFNYTRLLGEHQSCISESDTVEELVKGP